MNNFIEVLIAIATILISISSLKNKDSESNSYSLIGLVLLDIVIVYNLFN